MGGVTRMDKARNDYITGNLKETAVDEKKGEIIIYKVAGNYFTNPRYRYKQEQNF